MCVIQDSLRPVCNGLLALFPPWRRPTLVRWDAGERDLIAADDTNTVGADGPVSVWQESQQDQEGSIYLFLFTDDNSLHPSIPLSICPFLHSFIQPHICPSVQPCFINHFHYLLKITRNVGEGYKPHKTTYLCLIYVLCLLLDFYHRLRAYLFPRSRSCTVWFPRSSSFSNNWRKTYTDETVEQNNELKALHT